MSLNKNTLKTELQKFLDNQYVGFVGYPENVSGHKTKFAGAILTYLTPILVVSPPSVTPNDTQINVLSSGDDYADELILAIGPASLQYDTEMSNGYESMLSGAVLIPSGDYLGGAVNPITLIDALIVVGKTAIKTIIGTLAGTYNTGEYFCETVSDAIHTNVLTDLVTTCTYTNPTPPATTGAPLAYG